VTREVKINLPDELAEVVEQRAEEIGVPTEEWLSLMVTDMVADLSDGDDADDWISR